MSWPHKFFYKNGHVISQVDMIKAINAESCESAFYRVEVWGSHATIRRITEQAAGSNPIVITVRSKAGA